MKRSAMSAVSALFALALVEIGIARAADKDDKPEIKIKSNTDQTLVVAVWLPGTMKYAQVWSILDKLKDHGANCSAGVAKDGEPSSAEIVARPHANSKCVAAVVDELLRNGITKISIEVKK